MLVRKEVRKKPVLSECSVVNANPEAVAPVQAAALERRTGHIADTLSADPLSPGGFLTRDH
ncbi:hypothetical protein H0I39_04455 [Ottowia beijingensis]|uniref:Uncharacterized protein n=1 Tax=Ottowia beijingensis TaxID=1207057 RepID=A0A853IUY3_9BURK|nr:hypothetical protein [Ottowia beijingensis]NZA01207.1 hypothetical protein [Ottowia beijingensis]